MDWAEWEPWYEAVLEDMGYDRAEDRTARDLLTDLLASRETAPASALTRRFDGKVAHVVGAGPGLPDLAARDLPDEGDGVLVACDAAVTRLRSLDRVPDVVVTDLDGPRDDLVAASAEGALPVVHGHGDNRPALRDVVPALEDPLVGTCQCRPRDPVACWGGFTDGDRAAHLAAHHGVQRVRCLAFDLSDPGPGPTADREEKARKLAWARRLLAAVPCPVDGVDLDGADATPP